MHIAALSAGGQAPSGRFNGAVHSVFRQACNIRLDDGRLLALLAPHLGNAPHGIRLDLPPGFGFSRQVAVGQRVGCRADVLRVASDELSIDLGAAQAWRGELPAGGVDLTNPDVAQAWRAAWHALRHARPRTDIPEIELIGWIVDDQGVRLARAARVLQVDQAARALDRLIGCGPGLTPSGDDLVVGFLAGLWSTIGRDPARRAFLQELCVAVVSAAAATGDISRAYLMHAAQGLFAEPLTTLAWHLCEGAAVADVERATMAALRVGHTSGADGAFGLLLGFAAWAAQSVLAGLSRASNVVAGLAPAIQSSFRRDGRLATAGDAWANILECGGCSGAVHREVSRMLTFPSSTSLQGGPWDRGNPSPPLPAVARGFPGSHGPVNADVVTTNG
jgi:Protein of unknown function (DUF2877)